MKKNSILIVDDDVQFLNEVKTALTSNGYKVFTASTGGEAKAVLKKHRICVVLLDKKLPDIDGQDLVDEIKKSSKDTVFIVMTAYGSMDSSVKAFREGVADYIIKPASVETILERIKNVIHTKDKSKKELKLVKNLKFGIKEAKKYGELILGITPSAVFTVDKDRKVVSWNKRAEQVTGFLKEEIIGKECLIFAEEPCKDRCGLFSKDVNKPITGKECIIRAKDGRLLNISKNVDFLRDEFGEVIGGIESFEDITERRQIMARIEESERKYRAIFDGAAEGILVAEIKSRRFLFANPAICNMLGYTVEELKNMTVNDIHPKEFIEYVNSQFVLQTDGKKVLAESLPCLRKDGVIIYADVKASKAIIDGKEINIGFFTDVTVQKKQREENIKLSSVARDISEGVLITSGEDGESIIAYSNVAAEKMMGYVSGELNGKQSNIVFSELNPPLLYSEVEKKLNLGLRWSGEILCKRIDNTSFPAILLADPLRTVSTEVSGAILILIDITEKRILEDELRNYAKRLEETVARRTADLQTAFSEIELVNKKLKQFDALKSQFVANVAHELSNPLTIIRESIRNVLDGITGEISIQAKTSLYISEKEINRLLRFTSSMLSLSKIESGKMPVSHTAVNLIELLDEIREYFKESFKKKEVTFLVNIEMAPLSIWADRDLIKELFINLLQNALKYTPFGKNVELKVIKNDDALRFEIKDDGPGIAKEAQEKVFDKFYRIFQEKEEGTGLGLSIVKEIVQLHKGKIWVESEEGKGAAFIVVLPLDLRKESV